MWSKLRQGSRGHAPPQNLSINHVRICKNVSISEVSWELSEYMFNFWNIHIYVTVSYVIFLFFLICFDIFLKGKVEWSIISLFVQQLSSANKTERFMLFFCDTIFGRWYDIISSFPDDWPIFKANLNFWEFSLCAQLHQPNSWRNRMN